jgi:hypothetical protein
MDHCETTTVRNSERSTMARTLSQEVTCSSAKVAGGEHGATRRRGRARGEEFQILRHGKKDNRRGRQGGAEDAKNVGGRNVNAVFPLGSLRLPGEVRD